MLRIASKSTCREKKSTQKILAFVLSLLICTGGCSVQSGPKPNESVKNGSGETAANPAAAQGKDPANTYYIGKEVECPVQGEGEQLRIAGAAVSNDNVAVLFSVGVVDPDSEYSELKYSSSMWTYGKDGSVKNRIEMNLPSNGSALRGLALTANPKGGFSGLFMTESKRFQLFHFDEDGKSTGDPIYLPGIDDVYPADSLEYDAEGNINIAAYEHYYKFSPEGKTLLKIEDKAIEGGLFFFGDQIYVSGYHPTGANSGEGALFPVDASGSLGEPFAESGSHGLQMYTANGVLYGSDSDAFYQVDTAADKKETLLYWNRTDLVTGNTKLELFPVGDASFFCIQSAYNTNTLTFTLLTEAPADYLEGKTILTLAGVGLDGDPALQKAVNAFNRENPEYRVEIIDYMMRYGPESAESREEYLDSCDTMIQKIKLEIMSGNGPDMLMRSGDQGIDLMYNASSGLLVDLMPLINGDSDFHEQDYVGSILNATKKDGKLYQFPLTFYFSGLLGSADRVPDITGWTPDSFLQFAEGLPEGTTPFMPLTMRSELLAEILPYSQSSFVDPIAGTVQFDSPDFIKLLDIVKAYSMPDKSQDELLTTTYTGDPFADFLTGEYCFFNMRGISTPWQYADCDEFCGSGGCVFTGYPSVTGAGPMGHLRSSIGIVDKADTSEGCWAFLKSLLSEENQRNLTATMNGDSFRSNPILSSLLDEYIETSTEGIQPGQEIGMFDQESKPVTAEQAKEYRDLINGITMISEDDREITSIILEESAAYLAGQKTSEEVVSLIQNRVQTLVYERS
jgi:ABC-type glycerol-3-phosphate transport system substrate-binding protein